jgi:hypothetical protein
VAERVPEMPDLRPTHQTDRPPAPIGWQIEVRVRGSGRAVFTFSVTPDTGSWILG